MAKLTVAFEGKRPSVWWNVDKLGVDLVVGAASRTLTDEELESEATFAVNIFQVRKLEWWYGFVERRDPFVDDQKRERIEVVFDCIQLIHFEASVPSFAKFYPAGIDLQEDVQSVDYVYKDTLAASNTDSDRTALDGDRIAEHVAAVEAMLDDTHQCVVRLDVDPDLGSSFLPDLWYLLSIDPVNQGPGLPAERYGYPAAFEGSGAALVTLEDIFTLDPTTRRRLQRVISLDFVRDLDINPPNAGEGEPEPVLVLMPGGNDFQDRWTGWEYLITDYGPILWDEKVAMIQLMDVPVILPSEVLVEDPPPPIVVSNASSSKPGPSKPKVVKKKPSLQSQKTVKPRAEEETKSEKKQKWTVYQDPIPHTSAPLVVKGKQTDAKDGKVSRPVLRSVHPNLQRSPTAKEKTTRRRFEGAIPTLNFDD